MVKSFAFAMRAYLANNRVNYSKVYVVDSVVSHS